MSEDAPAVPTPWVLDSSVLVEVARGDTGTMTFVQELDARGRPLVIPALAVTGASLDMRSGEAAELLEGLEQLKNAMTAALRDAEQAVRLAAVIASTGLDPWDAHVAAVADAAVCPILTLDGARWREHAADLDEPLHVIEVADPDGAPGGAGPGALGARSGTRSRHLSYLLPCFCTERDHGGGTGRAHQPRQQAGPGLAAGAQRRMPGVAPACRICGWSARNASRPAAGADSHGGAPDHARSQVTGLAGGQARPGGEAVQGPPHVGGE